MNMPSITPENARISMRGSIAYVSNEELIVPRKEPGTLRTNFKEMNQKCVLLERISLSPYQTSSGSSSSSGRYFFCQ